MVKKNLNYKETGIDWIGVVPNNWEIAKPKFKLNRVTRAIDEVDEVVTCFRDGTVTLRKNKKKDGFTNSLKEHGYQQIRPGDLVIHEMDSFAGAMGISDSKGKSTPVYTVIEPSDGVELKYIFYLLKHMSKSGKITSLAKGIRERTTDFRWNMWSSMNFPFPPHNDQQLISNYLDKKVNIINKLILNLKKEIDLLKEKKKSLIINYTTKSFENKKDLKDKNLDLIKKIPINWKISKIKFIKSEDKYSLVDGPFGSDLKSEHYDENGEIIVIESGFLYEGNFNNRKREFKKISKNHFKKIKRSECNENDIIIAKIGDCGISAILPKLDNPSVISGNCCKLKISERHNNEFIHYWMLMLKYRGIINNEINQTGQPFISLGTINNLIVFLPPNDEQKEIVTFLNTAIEKIDFLIKKKIKKLNLIKEYKDNLISLGVTGKLKIKKI